MQAEATRPGERAEFAQRYRSKKFTATENQRQGDLSGGANRSDGAPDPGRSPRTVDLQNVPGAKQADGDNEKLQHLAGANPVHQLGDHCQDRDGQPGELQKASGSLHGSHSSREPANWQPEALATPGPETY